jgi:UDP-N-acetyl-D-mannosaminuronic acid dehydrogenase
MVEPHLDTLPETLAGVGELVGLEEAINRSDVVVLLVDHDSFKAVKRRSLRGKAVLDTRGLWR